MPFYKPVFIFIFLCAAVERLISTFKKRQSGGEVSYPWTTYLLISSYLLCVFFALIEFMQKESIDYVISLVGILVAGTGAVLRNASIKALGDFWSVHIKIFEGQKIIKTGPYGFFRHPYSLAVILELIGASLFFNAFLAIFVVLLIHFPLMLLRILLEQKVLMGIDKSKKL